MKNVMSVIGTGALMIGAGYGAYSFMNNNKSKIMKQIKKSTKMASPYTAAIKK